MFETYEDDGVIDVAAGAQHGRTTVVVREIFALLRKLTESGPDEDELQKARDRHLWSVEAMLDDADALAGFYGLAALAGIARTPAARHAELAAVTPADVRTVAASIFRPDRLSAVAVGLLTDAEHSKLERIIKGF
jgi:predicted Zn-dependent peptidase